jgi:aryl-alcohol dehydrogenase-like predicted oxidoreductase
MRVMGAGEAAPQLVRRAVELGVQFIDTADVYGDGASEQIIAEALVPYPDDVLIATKGGFVPGPLTPGAPGEPMLPADGRPEYLRRVCDASLRRLRIDTIDLYQLHAPDPKVPFEDSIGALVQLRDEGKVRHVGLSNVNRKHLATAVRITPIASVQNRYNPTDRRSERVLEMCEEHGIAFLPWGPISVDNEAIDEIASREHATPQQVALAWLLARSPVMLPIPGTSSIAHLEANVGALDLELSDEDVAAVSALAEQ